VLDHNVGQALVGGFEQGPTLATSKRAPPLVDTPKLRPRPCRRRPGAGGRGNGRRVRDRSG
jgi:hypothetical protein